MATHDREHGTVVAHDELLSALRQAEIAANVASIEAVPKRRLNGRARDDALALAQSGAACYAYCAIAREEVPIEERTWNLWIEGEGRIPVDDWMERYAEHASPDGPQRDDREEQ